MTEPTLVYDDDCGFCTWWANWIEARSDVPLVGFSELDQREDLRSRLPDDYESCSHLVTDDAVYSCGASIEEALVRSEVCQGLDLAEPVDFLRHFEDYNRFRESVYRWTADHRRLMGYVFRATPAVEESEDVTASGDDETGGADDESSPSDEGA